MSRTDGRAEEAFSGGMSDKTFARFSHFVHNTLGIKMPDVKKTMLQARLQKRMRKLGMNSYEDYWEYVFNAKDGHEERQAMIDVITTNKTDFFREPKHFEYLTQILLPKICGHQQARPSGKEVKFWSAGCSTGEEPYTLAMVLSDFAEKRFGIKFSILATDISVEVLKKAAAGIYDMSRSEPIPVEMKRKYLLKSKDRKKALVRVAPHIRSMVRFQRLNLMTEDYMIRDAMDIVFFRNVLIYFDRPTQEMVLNRICRHLKKDGHLFTGHSETLSGLRVPLIQVVATVYKKI